jgi:hypothetical protein
MDEPEEQLRIAAERVRGVSRKLVDLRAEETRRTVGLDRPHVGGHRHHLRERPVPRVSVPIALVDVGELVFPFCGPAAQAHREPAGDAADGEPRGQRDQLLPPNRVERVPVERPADGPDNHSGGDLADRADEDDDQDSRRGHHKRNVVLPVAERQAQPDEQDQPDEGGRDRAGARTPQAREGCPHGQYES